MATGHAQYTHDTLLDLAEALGDRPAVVARELTKVHEELARGTLTGLAARFSGVLGRAVAADLRVGDVQALDFPDNSFDTVIATFVFCSVPDPVQGLRELGRVVKPGGQILLLEHVRVDRPLMGRAMDLLSPLVVRIWGANINRRTVENVKRAGLKLERIKHFGPMGMVKSIVARPK